MNAFVLCTGRCGSRTMTAALRHVGNGWTVAHESRIHVNEQSLRLAYPTNHIEVDNRLSWFLGSLEEQYGDYAIYAHLTRDPDAVALSYANRTNVRAGLMSAFAAGIIMGQRPRSLEEALPAARLMVKTINDNIRAFLRDKTRAAYVSLENPGPGMERLWTLLEGSGTGFHTALREFDTVRR